MILVTRAVRRTLPDGSRWSEAAWNWSAPALRPGSRSPWPPLAGGGLTLLGLAIGLQLLLRPAPAPPVPEPVWVETVPPRQQASAPAPRHEAPRPVAAATVPSLPASETPETPPPPQTLGDPSPSTQGSMAVAQGSAQGTETQELPPSAPELPAGPVAVAGVPASVSPLLPAYPARAEAEGREGTVVALVVTDTLGRVVDLRIERSAGRDFDESVRRAALASRFVVPRREGKALAVAFRLPYRFRLD